MSLPLSAVREGVDDAGIRRDLDLISGTGFIVEHRGAAYLVTNWHIATSRSPITGEPLGRAALPERLTSWLSLDYEDAPTTLGWHAWSWNLYDDEGHARWLVHPTGGSKVDVVALPIEPASTIASGHDRPTIFYPYAVDEPREPAALFPTADVSVIGFPYGLTSGGKLPVWTRATVASEPDTPYDEDPCFLIDARTREQQSGSPVVGYWVGPKVLANGTTYIGETSWEIFGIYSSRVFETSDLGRVWRREVIREIIEGGRRDDLTYDREAD